MNTRITLYIGRKFPLIKLLCYLSMVLVFGSCNHSRNDPGRAYMAEFDMYYSKAYDPFTANPVFSDSLTMQGPPASTLAENEILIRYQPKSTDEQTRAGKELVNPVSPSEGSLDTGKMQYETFCMVCHGDKGDGNGPLVKTGKYPAKPRELNGSYIKGKPDGELFYTITFGSVSGLMGSYGAQVHPDNRWKIIDYVRTLQSK